MILYRPMNTFSMSIRLIVIFTAILAIKVVFAPIREAWKEKRKERVLIQHHPYVLPNQFVKKQISFI